MSYSKNIHEKFAYNSTTIYTKLVNSTLVNSPSIYNGIQNISDKILNNFDKIINFFGSDIESKLKLFGRCGLSFISYKFRIKPMIVASMAKFKLEMGVLAIEVSLNYKIYMNAFNNLLVEHDTVVKSCLDNVEREFSPEASKKSLINCFHNVREQSYIFNSLLSFQLKQFANSCWSTSVS